MAGQIEIVRLLDLAAQRLKIAIDYDAAALRQVGPITVRSADALTDQELWVLVNRVLAARGFTSVRGAGTSAYSIVKLAEAPGLARTETDPSIIPVPGYRSVVVRTQNRLPKDMVEAVSKILSKPGGIVSAMGDGGLIMVSDLSTHVDQALEVLKLMDSPTGATTVEEVPLRNMSAQAMALMVAQVAAKRDAIAGQKTPGDVLASPDGNTVLLIATPDRLTYWRELITSLDRRESATTQTYSPRLFAVREVARLIEQSIRPSSGGGGANGDDRWKLVIDELTGSLIITATAAQHVQIKSLIERLDSAPTVSRRPMRSFVIRNRPVKEIKDILDQLIQSGMLTAEMAATPAPGSAPPATGAATWPPAAPAQPAAPNPSAASPAASPARPQNSSQYLPGAAPKASASEVNLSCDEGTNTLIAMGEPRFFVQIESLLETLDVRQPQVMLDILILSLSDSQTLDLGIELEKLTTAGDVRGRVSSLFGLGLRDAGGNRTAGDGLGFTGVVLSPGDFSVVLRALETLNRGRSLSMPRLLVTNNQQALLDSVLEQPYSSTNASNTVTTTSFGGSKPAGTQLTLKPQITGGRGGGSGGGGVGRGDHLLLEYSVSLSAFVGAAANSSVPPPRQENKVQSVANLPDGYTVVVGGIELASEGKSTSQVPLLSHIPVLGEAFKNRSNNTSRSRFYIFIRATILRARDFEDLKYMSDVAASQAGIDDGWPVVEPRVMR